jgi:hypothetical protein
MFPTDDVVTAMMYERNLAEIQGGLYLRRFLWLFTPGLEKLSACLDAWPFLVSPCNDRVIIGRNAYGAIAFIDGATVGTGWVSVVDPLTLRVLRDPVRQDLVAFLAQTLPERRMRTFLDSSVYDEWLYANQLALDDDLALAIQYPLPLDGKMELGNFRVEPIVDYYRSTAAPYAKAVAAMNAR